MTMMSPPPPAAAAAAQQSSEAAMKNGFLTIEQDARLHSVLDTVVSVDSQYGYASVRFTLREYLRALRRRLNSVSDGDKLRLKLNGGAAAYVIHSGFGAGRELGDCRSVAFNDFDVVIEDCGDEDGRWEAVRELIFDCLAEVAVAPSLRSIVWDAYVSSMVRVWSDEDRWALVCFTNALGQNLEVKYVVRIKRQYQFSVDSFHIHLHERTLASALSPLPTLVESVYGNYEEAYTHLKQKLIVTHRPEEIRGGGLLRYCQLLVNGFTPVLSTRRCEPYMCVRFLIDYPTLDKQQRRLMDYIGRHFVGEAAHTSGLPPICEWLCRLKSIMSVVPGTSPYTVNLVSEMAHAACYVAAANSPNGGAGRFSSNQVTTYAGGHRYQQQHQTTSLRPSPANHTQQQQQQQQQHGAPQHRHRVPFRSVT
uniref:polynucleotide adenylyltransferase n=1 Tax=Fundulus heteroclitus TaxID=8078 RepID=A0A146UNB0_FUNHE